MFKCEKCGKFSKPGETSVTEVVEHHANGNIKKEIRVHAQCPVEVEDGPKA